MRHLTFKILAASLLAASIPAWSQTCQGRDEIPEQVRSAIESAAQQTYDQAARGDVNSLKTNSIPMLQSNFNGIAAAINDNKDAFGGAKPQLRTDFLLDNAANSDGNFYCGVYGGKGGSSGNAQFSLPGLDAGKKYAVVIQDFMGNKGPYIFTTIFEDMGGWKIAGLQIRPSAAAGHDGLWYLKQARDYKTKGQAHNAWFYYATSWELLAPIPAMNTALLGNIQEESNGILPKDVPFDGKPVAFTANGKNYTITDMSPYKTDKNFDLSVKYSVPSTADFNATQADARNLANALVTQYPELKDGFNNVWVHAVDPNGGDVVGLVKLK
jgi:DNA-binding transcriptional regulator YdaS (Cro superfamily)